MFCPSNETLLSLTEKTKLLAQKCTQQIRAQSGLSPMRKETATFHLPTPTGVADGGGGGQREVNGTEFNSDPASTNGAGGGGGATVGSVSLNCFNTRGATAKTCQANARKQSTGCCTAPNAKERTTKWYVKVIQMT